MGDVGKHRRSRAVLAEIHATDRIAPQEVFQPCDHDPSAGIMGSDCLWSTLRHGLLHYSNKCLPSTCFKVLFWLILFTHTPHRSGMWPTNTTFVFAARNTPARVTCC